jgi:hypothetical protein
VSTSSDTWARRAGLAIGLLLALGAVLSWRVAAEGATVGAEARFLAVPPGELTVAPAGTFVSARQLRPGGAVRGELRLRNITGAPVSVRLRALPSGRDLDRLLRVDLGRGERRALPARVWLPASADGAAAGAAVDVTVELRVEPRRG